MRQCCGYSWRISKLGQRTLSLTSNAQGIFYNVTKYALLYLAS